MPANVPMSDTGTAMNGISVARQLCRNRNTTSNTSSDRLDEGLDDLLDRDLDEARGVERDGVAQPAGKRLADVSIVALTGRRDLRARWRRAAGRRRCGTAGEPLKVPEKS